MNVCGGGLMVILNTEICLRLLSHLNIIFNSLEENFDEMQIQIPNFVYDTFLVSGYVKNALYSK